MAHHDVREAWLGAAGVVYLMPQLDESADDALGRAVRVQSDEVGEQAVDDFHAGK